MDPYSTQTLGSDHVFVLGVEQRFHSFPVPWIELSALIHVSYMEVANVAMNGWLDLFQNRVPHAFPWGLKRDFPEINGQTVFPQQLNGFALLRGTVRRRWQTKGRRWPLLMRSVSEVPSQVRHCLVGSQIFHWTEARSRLCWRAWGLWADSN